MPTYRTTIELDVEVHYTAHPACKGARDSLGVPTEPDEPAHIEIDYVECIEASFLSLGDATLDRIRTEIAEALDEREEE